MQKTLIIAVILAILLVIFALQNAAEVLIKFWLWESYTSLALVLLITFGVGSVIGVLFSIPSIRKRSATSTQKSKEIQSLKDEIKNLKLKLVSERNDKGIPPDLPETQK